MEISKIKLGSTTYDIKDSVARLSIGGAIILRGTTTTALSDEATTNPIVIGGESYTAVSNDAVFYGKKEFVFDGTMWHQFGDMSGLGDLAGASSGSVTVTPEGTNSSSAVSLTGGAVSRLSTTTITGTNGTVTASKVSSVGSSKMVTTTLKGVSGTLTTHDTPTLNTSSIGSASGWNAGTMFSASIDESNELLTLTAGTAPSLTVTSMSVGTSITAGTAQTVAVANSSNTTVATGSIADSGTGSSVVTSVTTSDVTAAVASSQSTTVATGSVSSSGDGAQIVTSLPTGGTAAAQTFTGTSNSYTVTFE